MHSRESPQGLPPSAERQPQDNVFRREGEYWTIAHDGIILRLRDSKGLRYLACLLAHPGERMLAIDLLEKAGEQGVRGFAVREEAALTANPQPPDSLLLERARLAVTKRIKSAVRKIHEHDPRLGYHLSLTVKTGVQCVYLADPARPILWVM